MAIILGWLLPSYFSWAGRLADFILGTIFFISALGFYNPATKSQNQPHLKTVILFNVFTLLLLPLLVLAIGSLILPSNILLALVLLSAMPAGLTSPIIVKSIAGNVKLALWLTVSSALLAPVSIPLVMSIGFGKSIDFAWLEMFTKLLLVIILPLMLAWLVKKTTPTLAKKIDNFSQPVSLVGLLFLIAGIVALQIGGTGLSLFALDGFWPAMISLFAFFGFLHLLGYGFTFFWQKNTSTVFTTCLVYTNFTLALTLAKDFFPEPMIIITLALATVPWALGMGWWQARQQKV